MCPDGRIDNRNDLLLQLERSGHPLPAGSSDVEIALSGYRIWHLDLFEKLVGDFAIVIWDERTEHLICTRDALGRRLHFYHVNSSRFVCGTVLRQVLCD